MCWHYLVGLYDLKPEVPYVSICFYLPWISCLFTYLICFIFSRVFTYPRAITWSKTLSCAKCSLTLTIFVSYMWLMWLFCVLSVLNSLPFILPLYLTIPLKKWQPFFYFHDSSNFPSLTWCLMCLIPSLMCFFQMLYCRFKLKCLFCLLYSFEFFFVLLNVKNSKLPTCLCTAISLLVVTFIDNSSLVCMFACSRATGKLDFPKYHFWIVLILRTAFQFSRQSFSTYNSSTSSSVPLG